MTKDTIITGDALEILKSLPDQCVHCVVTSPPYWGLRDYGLEGQMGSEKTPEEFIEKMVVLFREVRRVLLNDGTCWINIGDSYYGRKGMNGASTSYANHERTLNKKALLGTKRGEYRPNDRPHPGLKPKDLVGIPWMLAFALRADGWYLRQDIVWNKPNPMPESVTDRCTRSHEFLFMLSKSKKYYYDAAAIRTPPAESSLQRWSQNIEAQAGSDRVPGKTNGAMKAVGGYSRSERQRGHVLPHKGFNDKWDNMALAEQQAMGANKRSVWTAATASFKEAHFATFPEELIVDCIKAGCPAGGIVLDPFMGAGTTALVAKKQGRHYLGIELNPTYVDIAEARLKKELGLFA